MKRCVLVCVLLLTAVPLWAGYGLSNVVTRQIQRGPVIEEVTEAAAEMPEVQPAVQEIPPAQPAVSATARPYTIHLSSWRNRDEALREMEEMRSRLDTIFITKIDLGPSGVWYRVDHGMFPTIREAVARIRDLKSRGVIDRGAFVGGEVGLAIELGTYESMEEAREEAQELALSGIAYYIVREGNAVFRLLVGAYNDEKSAVPAMEDLRALGYSPVLKKR
jgi:septal ring-binding cell division protein DamX